MSVSMKDLSLEELHEKLANNKKAIMNSRFKKAYGQLSDTSVLSKLRRDTARIMTVIKQKQIGQ